MVFSLESTLLDQNGWSFHWNRHSSALDWNRLWLELMVFSLESTLAGIDGLFTGIDIVGSEWMVFSLESTFFGFGLESTLVGIDGLFIGIDFGWY